MKAVFSLLIGFIIVSDGFAAVITGACDRDPQCGGGMCCAVSLWIKSLRMCAPMGTEGDYCHPQSHKGYNQWLHDHWEKTICFYCMRNIRNLFHTLARGYTTRVPVSQIWHA